MSTSVGIEAPARPWKRAAAWLALLGPLFYLTYGAANYLAAQRADVGSAVFAWERSIPFVAWTILPYWSINLFYAASLFVCTSATEVDRLGRRLLTAQAIAVACFIAFPLRFTFPRPETSGVSGFLFDALTSFDKPFNQAPSLHIVLLVILWDFYARHLPRVWRPVLHLWFAVVGLSVLTTYQHHVIDIPTGALAGFLCLWLWPDEGEPPLSQPDRLSPPASEADPARRRLALRYALGALSVAAASAAIGGAGLWLLWGAVALALVAANYAVIGAKGFQKGADGRLSLAAHWLFAPYILTARLNSRLWTKGERGPATITGGVLIGRLPTRREARALSRHALVDASAELPSPRGFARVVAVPMLDLAAPPPDRLREAADAVERLRRHGPVLVACALGYSRSAAVTATWLLRSGRAASLDDAVALVRAARPRIVLGADARAAIEEAAK